MNTQLQSNTDAQSKSEVDAAFLKAQIELAEELRQEGGYLHIRILEDGSIAALLKLIYTVAICQDLNRFSWVDRFCFEDANLAVEQYKSLKSADDVPVGFIASRTARRVPRSA